MRRNPESSSGREGEKKHVLLSVSWIPWIAITVGQRELNTALLVDPEVVVF
jgi:hypothetical protein